MQINQIEYNSSTMPESIHKFFCSLGNERSQRTDKTGKTIYGEKLRPFMSRYTFKKDEIRFDCYMLEWNFELFLIRLKKGEIMTKTGLVLNWGQVQEYLVEYAIGFQKGYSEFNEHVNNNAVFSLSNEDKAHKVYSRIRGILSKKGSINISGCDFSDKKLRNYISKELLYEEGINGGEYYKAWEIVLTHPMQFKKLFDDDFYENNDKPLTEFEEMKEMAIDETRNYFEVHHSLSPSKQELKNFLNNEEKYFNRQKLHNESLIEQNRSEELKQELIGYLKENESLKNSILLNKDGYVTNSKPINVVNEFCQYSFYYLFHSKELIKMKGVNTEPMKPMIKSLDSSTLWFQIGLLFATGEMEQLRVKFNGNATQIANSLGNKNYRPYISESLSMTNKSDKNIFSQPKKLKSIYEYCIQNNIDMTESFTSSAQVK